MTKPTIVICASASFYPEVIRASDTIEEHRVTVILPKTAARMKAGREANIEAISDWSTAAQGYHGKALLIKEHFKEIEQGDAILVMNYEKHGKQNYIGPNVLMEMSTAFYLNKPIFVLNGEPEDSPLIDEILGVEPIFLHGDLSQLSNFKT